MHEPETPAAYFSTLSTACVNAIIWRAIEGDQDDASRNAIQSSKQQSSSNTYSNQGYASIPIESSGGLGDPAAYMNAQKIPEISGAWVLRHDYFVIFEDLSFASW